MIIKFNYEASQRVDKEEGSFCSFPAYESLYDNVTRKIPIGNSPGAKASSGSASFCPYLCNVFLTLNMHPAHHIPLSEHKWPFRLLGAFLFLLPQKKTTYKVTKVTNAIHFKEVMFSSKLLSVSGFPFQIHLWVFAQTVWQ